MLSFRAVGSLFQTVLLRNSFDFCAWQYQQCCSALTVLNLENTLITKTHKNRLEMLVGLCYSSGACAILFVLNLHQFEGPYHIMPFICISRGGHNVAMRLFSIPFRFPLFDLYCNFILIF